MAGLITLLATQSNTALLDRFHKGGQDMPPFPQLSEPEIRALLAYLRQLAGIPGAEKGQVAINESPADVGEQIGLEWLLDRSCQAKMVQLPSGIFSFL